MIGVKNMNNILIYEMANKDTYLYDNKTGLILNIDSSFLMVLNEMRKNGFLENKIYNNHNLEYYKFFLEKYDNLYKSANLHNKKKCTIKDIEKHIETHGMKQLIFDMTEQCNLRCKYCIYSDYYPYHRSYRNKALTFEIAKKAIDLYMYYFTKVYKYNPKRRPVFTFYGGEPLLEFKIVKNIVEYVLDKYKYYNPMFNMTTNGTLLSDEVLQYINNIKDFYISISLDGPKKEHDRNRVFSNGKGSFDLIYTNLIKIREVYPTIWGNLNLLACYDFNTDISKTEEFFENESLPPLIRVSMVEPLFSTYYQCFTVQDKNKFLQTYSYKQKQYIENIKSDKKSSRYSDLMFGTFFFFLYNRFKFYSNNVFFDTFTGTCIPGDKLYVDTQGRLHICEKINFNFSIGDVYNGLNLKRISEIIERYNEEVLSKCKNCPISRICGTCYATFASNGYFEIPKGFCESKIKSTEQALKDLTEVLIHNPSYFKSKYSRNKNDNLHYKDLYCY